MSKSAAAIATAFLALLLATPLCSAEGLSAGAARIDITSRESGPVIAPLSARALVLKKDNLTVAVITLDVVSFGKIGYIKDDFIPKIRARVAAELKLNPMNIVFNASHCHGVPCGDVLERTFTVLKEALGKLEPVTVGVGTGREIRVQENRRMKLKDGRTIDVRHAYSLPPDAEVAEVGPIDPDIGIVRLDKINGDSLAVLYNFACHPIMGSPVGGPGSNTADMTGYSSQVIEDNMDEGTIALFIQGCGGDINPISYKHIHEPNDAEPLGNMLGLSTLKALRKIESTADDRLVFSNETIELPRADLAQRIGELEQQQQVLMRALRGTSLNFKDFMQLASKHNLSAEFPSYHASRYLHEDKIGRPAARTMDSRQRSLLRAYLQNIHTMENLTRVSTNLRLLKLHQQQFLEADKRAIDVEITGLRIGGFQLVTFPGELTVQVGLDIKAAVKEKNTFVAGYTNGYIYYAPNAEQLKNVGGAQEDSDCILAPEWHRIFEKKALEVLGNL